MSLLSVLRRWFDVGGAWLRSISWFARAPHRTRDVEDLPDRLEGGVLYIVGEHGFPVYAAMACPDRCGAILHMNLVPDERPLWCLTKHDDGTVSLQPSVWRKAGCRSHFWLRRGRIHWCKPATPCKF